jgi:hypothetical protein
MTPPPRWTPLEVADRLICRWKQGSSENQIDRSFDERDIRLRDRAHYQAYRVLRSILGLAVILVIPILFASDTPDLIRRYGLLFIPLICLLVLVVWSLPQSIILWSEPDMEPETEDPAA